MHVMCVLHFFYKDGTVTSAMWQVTLCDRIWHASSLSSEAGLLIATLCNFTVMYSRFFVVAGRLNTLLLLILFLLQLVHGAW